MHVIWCHFPLYQLPNQAQIVHHSTISEPHSYYEASQDPKWVVALQRELTTLKANDTWELCDLPRGMNALGKKRVYKFNNFIQTVHWKE